HTSQRHNRIIFLRQSGALRRQRDFERPRNPYQIHLLLIFQRAPCTGNEPIHDDGIVFAGNDGESVHNCSDATVAALCSLRLRAIALALRGARISGGYRPPLQFNTTVLDWRGPSSRKTRGRFFFRDDPPPQELEAAGEER